MKDKLIYINYYLIICSFFIFYCNDQNCSATEENIIKESSIVNWKIYSNRNYIISLALSDDNSTLWVGTAAGLEKRDGVDGELKDLFTTLEGLIALRISSLVADGNNGVWAGTVYGLTHIDSEGNIRNYNHNNSKLNERWITDIYKDSNGTVWISTRQNLFIISEEQEIEPVATLIDKDDGEISKIMITGNTIWAALYESDGITGQGLARYNFDRSIVKYTSNLIGDSNIGDLLIDKNGGVWVATYDNGLLHLNENGDQKKVDLGCKPNSLSLFGYNVPSISSDHNGGLWISTPCGLVHMISETRMELINKDSFDLPMDETSVVLGSKDGSVWFGLGLPSEFFAHYGGLAHLSNMGRVKRFKTEIQVPSPMVFSILPGFDQSLFVGTNAGLAHIFPDGTSKIYNKMNSNLISNTFFTLSYATGDDLWVGNDDFLAYLSSDKLGVVEFGDDETEFETYGHSISWDGPGPLSGTIRVMISDGQDGLWIGHDGTYFGKGGITHLKSDLTFETFTASNSDLSLDNVWGLELDGRGGVWAGTYGAGLVHLNGSFAVESYGQDNSDLPDNDITSLLYLNEKLWIATDGGGLASFDSEKNFEIFTKNNSDLFSDYVRVLSSDGAGNLWIGAFGGISWFSPNGAWETYGLEESHLTEDNIMALHSDHAGGLWVGTMSQGLLHLSRIGRVEKIEVKDEHYFTMSWFLNRSPFEFHKIKYIELQRSLSKNGVYETVTDINGKPVRFQADYSGCPDPRVGDCWPSVEGHTTFDRGTPQKPYKGYTLDTPVTDIEWLEGVPRYYRLSAVIQKNGKLVRAANNNEAALITPRLKERPRARITLEKNSIALQPGSEIEISVFVSSLDLYKGDIQFQIESPENLNIFLDQNTLKLSPGETVSTTLKIKIPADITEITSIIRINATTKSEFTSESASLAIQVGTGSLISLGISQETTNPRVMDGITVSGNIIPPLSDQEIIITGEGIQETTLLTDDEGNFEGSVILIKSGTIILRADHNGRISNPVTIHVAQTRTLISLTSNVTQNTQKGDTLNIQGIMTPVRLFETKVTLDIRYFDPLDVEGKWQPQFVGSVRIDENGTFLRKIVVPGSGFIKVNANLPEATDFIAVNTELMIPIGQPVGEGIIVVSESGSSEYKEISKNLGSFVYNALIGRNIPSERIQYLGETHESSILNEASSKSTFHNKLTSWAVSLMATDDPYQTPLNLYLIGRVEGGNFKLNDDEILTANELGQYIDEAEQNLRNISPDSKGFPINIILEGSQSGAWIQKIAGDGRFILTSSSKKSLNAGGYAGYEGNGEYSFSRYFYQYINYGSDIDASYAEANYEILKFYHHIQRPQMDADGDGKATTQFDRNAATKRFIEHRPIGNLRPKIKAASTAKTIKGKVKSSLWAIATDPENDIRGVYCSLVDPIGETMTVNLEHDKGDMYKAVFNGYVRQGDYRLIYFAKDKVGNISLPKERFVNVIEAIANGVWDGATPMLPDPSPIVTLDAPTLLIEVDGLTATFNWDAVPEATGYNFCFDIAFDIIPYDGKFFDCIDIGNNYGKIPLELWPGAKFNIGIQAYNDEGMSDVSNIETLYISNLEIQR